jgi:5-carboxymethyl-2-hydroxymuconate isomerase
MPHVIAEYSANLEDSLDVRGLVDDLHQVMVESGLADIPAYRTRAKRRDMVRVGDGNPANAFVHITARLRVGRSKEQQTKLADALLAAADKRLEAAYKTHPTAITVEIENIDNITARKNTVRDKAEKAA